MRTHEQLRDLWQMSQDGDTYGTAMSLLFAVCECIHHDCTVIEVPAEWQYRHSPIECSPLDSSDSEAWWDEQQLRELLADGLVTELDVLHFGEVLHRLIGICKAQGRDY